MEIMTVFTMLNHFSRLGGDCQFESFFFLSEEEGGRDTKGEYALNSNLWRIITIVHTTFILTSLSQAFINYDCFQVRREVNARQTKRSNPPKQVSHFYRQFLYLLINKRCQASLGIQQLPCNCYLIPRYNVGSSTASHVEEMWRTTLWCIICTGGCYRWKSLHWWQIL